MRPRENYTRLVIVGLLLSLAILGVFQVYLLRETARIETVEAADLAAAREAGRLIYAENCADCHGEAGEGNSGPALNSKELLQHTSDEALYNLTRTGIPGSRMPAWGQTFGGPFTDVELKDLVAFMRAWELTAPEIADDASTPDPIRGATIFATTCAICHGQDGLGTEQIRALNDPKRLQDFDDGWYRSTIAFGRPARGMPTWGTVLSPQQINDVVALIALWREGETAAPNLPSRQRLRSALFSLRQFDAEDTVFHLNAALAEAEGPSAAEIQAVLDMIEARDLRGARSRLTALLPPEEMGQELFAGYCATCHGTDGTGGLGKSLHDSRFIQDQSDEMLLEFLLLGRSGTQMDGFQGILTDEELGDVAALLRRWQE